MSRTIRVSKIAILNRETFSKNETPRFFKYLDTGSLTKNVIDNFQTLDTTKEKIPSRAQRKVKDQTILYSTVRPNQEHYGFLIDPDENVVASTGFTTIDVVDEGVLPKFLYYLLTQNHITEYLHTIGTNSVSSYPSISPADIGFLEFEIPSLNIQTKIVKVLSDLDTKIELNNKINEELETMAKAIYDYWFVQFDFPISKEKADALGKPELEGMPYKSSGGKMVYNKELKREIPEGWEFEIIDNILDKKNWVGKLKTDQYQEKGAIPIIDQSKDYICGFTDAIDLVINGDVPKIIFGDHTRILKLINFNFVRGADGTQILLSKDKRIPQHYFYHSLLKFDLSNYGYARHFKFLKMLPIIKPKLDVIQKFENTATSFYKTIGNNIFENQKLVELRDWLLTMLMNGQVTVREAEQELSNAAELGDEYEDRKEAKILPFVPRVIPSEMQSVSEDSITTVHAALVSRILVTDKNLDTGERHLGRTLVEKTVHVIESHTKCDLGRIPVRKARGAADFQKIIKKVEPHAKQKKWFNSKKIDGKIYYTLSTNEFEGYRKSATYFRDQIKEVDRIVKLFLPLDTSKAEVYQTTYAAWHDLIAMGHEFSNDDIVSHASTEEGWTIEKESIPKEKFYEAIEWLKENNLVPDGKGKMTVKR
mgnify:CR=1 FL=1